MTHITVSVHLWCVHLGAHMPIYVAVFAVVNHHLLKTCPSVLIITELKISSEKKNYI